MTGPPRQLQESPSDFGLATSLSDTSEPCANAGAHPNCGTGGQSSSRQVAEQPSPSKRLPSSHCSSGPGAPLPQVSAVNAPTALSPRAALVEMLAVRAERDREDAVEPVEAVLVVEVGREELEHARSAVA